MQKTWCHLAKFEGFGGPSGTKFSNFLNKGLVVADVSRQGCANACPRLEARLCIWGQFLAHVPTTRSQPASTLKNFNQQTKGHMFWQAFSNEITCQECFLGCSYAFPNPQLCNTPCPCWSCLHEVQSTCVRFDEDIAKNDSRFVFSQ